jgi:myo-inositol-1(or 4)-monophosphatase
MPDDPRYLATAIDIVLRAGDIQLAHARQGLQVRKKGAIDLVTQADLAVEAMCRQILADRFPGHDVLAEENGETSGSRVPGEAGDRDRCRWIFDPIDGTTNYAHGVPIFCAALGLEIGGRMVVAAVYDPSRRELFTAERGMGAWLNGSRLAVSDTADVQDSLLVTGFPYDIQTNGGDILALFGTFIGRARAVRRLGSAALDLCYVAAGRFDGFWERRLHPWDVAAASLIVEEAGGRVTAMDGSPFDVHSEQVLATNGRIHEEMLDVVAVFEAGRARQRTD